MIKLLVILFLALTFEAIGVVYLSHGLKQLPGLTEVSVPGIVRLIQHAAGNADLIRGVFFEALFFAGLIYLMSRADVSFVWPLTALGFVFTTIAAKFFLGETVS